MYEYERKLEIYCFLFFFFKYMSAMNMIDLSRCDISFNRILIFFFSLNKE